MLKSVDAQFATTSFISLSLSTRTYNSWYSSKIHPFLVFSEQSQFSKTDQQKKNVEHIYIRTYRIKAMPSVAGGN